MLNDKIKKNNQLKKISKEKNNKKKIKIKYDRKKELRRMKS